MTSESGSDVGVKFKKVVCMTGDATGKHYLYGDSVVHEVSASTV